MVGGSWDLIEDVMPTGSRQEHCSISQAIEHTEKDSSAEQLRLPGR